MIRRIAIARATGLVGVAMLSFTIPAQAQDDAFKKGVEARNDKKWADVVPNMLSAIQGDGMESPREVRYGPFFNRTEVAYLPYFYLGEAHFNRKNCARAVEAWEKSEQQGVVKRQPALLSIMQQGMRACVAQGVLLEADFKAIAGSTREAYDRANLLAEHVVGLIRDAQSLVRPETRELFDRARAELMAANARLSSGADTRLRSDFTEARASVDRATELLRPAETTLVNTINTVAGIGRQSGEVEQIIIRAETTDRSVDELNIALTPQLEASRVTAREQLKEARSRLSAERVQNAASLDEAQKYAQSANTILSEVLERARQIGRASLEERLANAVKAAEELFSLVGTSLESLDRLVSERPLPPGSDVLERREAIRTQVDAQRRRFVRAQASNDVNAIDRAMRVTADQRELLDALMKSFGPVTLRDRGVNAALEEGARLFLSGQYREAMAALDPPDGLGEIPLQLHVHLFRAASAYALFVRSGGKDSSLHALAVNAIQRCKELNSAFEPDERAFSPAFIALYRQPNAAPVAGTQR